MRRAFPLPERARPAPEVWTIVPQWRLRVGPELAKTSPEGVCNTPRNDQSVREVSPALTPT